jgi:hypothetical protein
MAAISRGFVCRVTPNEVDEALMFLCRLLGLRLSTRDIPSTLLAWILSLTTAKQRVERKVINVYMQSETEEMPRYRYTGLFARVISSF